MVRRGLFLKDWSWKISKSRFTPYEALGMTIMVIFILCVICFFLWKRGSDLKENLANCKRDLESKKADIKKEEDRYCRAMLLLEAAGIRLQHTRECHGIVSGRHFMENNKTWYEIIFQDENSPPIR